MTYKITVKHCSKCKIDKPIEDFYRRTDKHDGYQDHCKICDDEKKRAYKSTLNGRLRGLLQHAKASAKKRTNEASEFNLSYDDLISLWKKQNGKCYYSNIVMTFTGSWKVSLERLDPKLGYVIDNVALICIEFQNQCNWSKDKVNDMLNILNQNIKENPIDFDESNARKNIRNTEKHKLKCNTCNIVKTKEEMKCNTICKACHNQENKSYREAPRGCLHRLVQAAKKRSKARSDKTHKKHDTTMDRL